jgi:hypothetical protein
MGPRADRGTTLIYRNVIADMKRWPLFLLGLLVLAIGGKYILGVLNAPDDKAQIKQALAEAIKASREGRPGSVIDKLSENFKVNGEEPGSRRIADLIKSSHPDVKIQDSDPLVSGDTAQINSDVTVSADYAGMRFDKDLKGVQLQFKKEASTEWLIFPTSKWHLSAARLSPEQIAEFTSSQ